MSPFIHTLFFCLGPSEREGRDPDAVISDLVVVLGTILGAEHKVFRTVAPLGG